ncbi:MAG TPA: DUF6293 family protein, partial [Candidatus Bathyarchaeia archaeon]|nr:DUF6293 family protein [Candidatus Bathyarchaeia archaeon]
MVAKTDRHGSDWDEESARSFRRTVQIATVDKDSNGVLAGVRNAPANKLVLICYDHNKDIAKRLATSITETLKTEVEVYDNVRVEHSYKDIMQVFSQIVEKNKDQYDDFLLNVSSGDKMICIAA